MLAAEFPPPVGGRRTLLLAGRAGQKVRSSAILLGRAGALCGLQVSQRDDYPVTVMTGHSTAEMIFQPDPINALGVDIPDIVILTAPEGVTVNAGRLASLPETTTVFAIPELLPVATPARVVEIPTEALGLKRQRTQLVLGCAAYVASRTGLLPLDSLLASARRESREEIAAANVKTIEIIRDTVLEE